MSDWDRIQRLEMDMAQLRARIKRMDDLNLALLRENEELRAVVDQIVMVPMVGEAT